MRAWRYVITADNGIAPNYDRPAVTLSICKPRIRKAALRGDLVLAFNGRTLSRNKDTVRWAGIVSEVIPLESYWEDPRFVGKRPGCSATPDNIYKLDGHAWRQVPNPSHGEGNVATDLRGKNALVFGKAWHFGTQSPELPSHFDLRIFGNRRLEPVRELALGQWQVLEAWLDMNDRGLPGSRSARARCR